VKIVLGFFIAFLLLNLFGLGLAVDHILVSAFPGEDVLSKFNSFLLYFFGLDLVLRFLLQKLPILPIQHYLHLPIPRSDLVHYAIVKSTLSFFNLNPFSSSTPTPSSRSHLSFHRFPPCSGWRLSLVSRLPMASSPAT
jgi:hypothetical protein